MRAISLALATVALAACDTDSPLEPTAPTASIPAAPQAAVGFAASGNLAWTVVKSGSNPKILLGGARFQVSGTRFFLSIMDNGAGDVDPALGKFKAAGLPTGTFSVCEIVAPNGYVIPSPSCHQLTVYANTTTTDEFANKQLPRVLVDMRNLQSALVGGGVLTIKAGGPTGTPVMSIIDNDSNDTNKTGGMFNVLIPAEGKYSVCAASPPSGYHFVTPYTVCHTLTFKAGTVTGGISWWVTPN